MDLAPSMRIFSGHQRHYSIKLTNIEANVGHELKKREADWQPQSSWKKRDFQELHPPRNEQEFYAGYDPSVGITTGCILVSFLILIMLQIICKWLKRRARRLKDKIRRKGSHFIMSPLREMATRIPTMKFRKKQNHRSQDLIPQSQTVLTVLTSGGGAGRSLQLEDSSHCGDTSESGRYAATFEYNELPPLAQHEEMTPHHSDPALNTTAININIIEPTPCVTPCPSLRKIPSAIEQCSCDPITNEHCLLCQNTLQLPLTRISAQVEVHRPWGLHSPGNKENNNSVIHFPKAATPPFGYNAERAVSSEELARLLKSSFPASDYVNAADKSKSDGKLPELKQSLSEYTVPVQSETSL